MEFLIARDYGTKVLFEIWLDQTKTLDDGKTPDPKWIMELTYGIVNQLNRDLEIQGFILEAKAMAKAYMAAFNTVSTGNPLPIEGTTF